MKLLLIISLLFSATANAGFLIEPYAGIGTYTTTYDVANPSNDSEADGKSSTVFGGRLGMSFILLSAGIDYELDTFDDGKRTHASFFVGVDLPILLRFWGEYAISSDLQHDFFDDRDLDVNFKSGYSLGVGFTGLPLVSLNLEIENTKYEIGDNDVDFDWASYLVSVSFPLDL